MPMRPPVFKPYWAGTKSDARAYDRKRNATPARKMLMSSAWRKASQGFLAKHPHCAPCARKGITRAATCTDHIIAHKGDPRLFWNRENWQPACAVCNSAKAAREEGGFGNPVR